MMEDPGTYSESADLEEPYYRHTQPGTFIRMLCLIVMGWLLLFAVLSTWLLYIVAGTVLLVMFLFHSLTVVIDDEYIRMWFGPGIVRKKIPLAEVAGCRIVRNRWWFGWGIKYVWDGWMWNVSGLDAVQLTYWDEHHFRIGTDEAEALCVAISATIEE